MDKLINAMKKEIGHLKMRQEIVARSFGDYNEYTECFDELETKIRNLESKIQAFELNEFTKNDEEMFTRMTKANQSKI